MTEGRTTLITGAGKRVGRIVALGLADDGYDVVVHYHSSSDDAEEVAAEIRAKGRRAWTAQADLSDPSNAQSLVETAVAQGGPISLLVNTASLFKDDSLATMSLETWDPLIIINLTSPVFLMKAFASQNEIPAGASVVNFLDQQIATPNPEFFSYFVAKIGLEGATRLAAFELAPKIRVNAVAPGLTLPSWGQDQQTFEARQNLTPLKAGLGPEDLLDAVRYLAHAERVTGHIIFVDSGQRLMGLGNTELAPND
ncbi:MAG: SDR family NAD(P)-dependent oxidoreductase [Pseudomonadota bacterium]